MFKRGEKIVYPGHGVAVIKDVVEKVVAGRTIKFFELSFLYKDMSILIPIHSIEQAAIRYLSDKNGVKLALEELRNPPERKLENLDFTPSGWNKRNKLYRLSIQEGQLVDLAKVYRDLMFVAKQKDLSFGERTLLQTAEELLAQEIVVILKKDKDTVLRELRSPFNEFTPIQSSDINQSTLSG